MPGMDFPGVRVCSYAEPINRLSLNPTDSLAKSGFGYGRCLEPRSAPGELSLVLQSSLGIGYARDSYLGVGKLFWDL